MRSQVNIVTKEGQWALFTVLIRKTIAAYPLPLSQSLALGCMKCDAFLVELDTAKVDNIVRRRLHSHNLKFATRSSKQ